MPQVESGPENPNTAEGTTSGGGEAEPLPRPSPTPVTLAEVIDEVLNNSLQIRAGSQSVVQAQADLRTASLIDNPEMFFLSSLNPFPSHPFSRTRQGGPPQYDVWVTWPVDWYLYGKRAAAIEAAQRQLDASAADFADFARLQVAQAVATYFGVLEAKALLQLAQENVANVQNVADVTRERVNSGGAPAIDLDRARLTLASGLRDMRNAEATLAAVKARLRALMGRTGMDEGFDCAGVLNIGRQGEGSVPPPPPALSQMVMSAEQWRPDMLAAGRRVEAAAARVVLEDRKRFPALGVITGWTYQVQQKSIGYPDEPSWDMGLSTPLPLFNRNEGNRWRARSELQQARTALEAQRVIVRSEVEQALAVYQAAYRIVTTDAPRQLDAARSVRSRIEESYREGGRTLFELLDAERIFRDTYRQQVTAEVAFWQAMHRLNAAVGRQVVP